MDNNNITDTLYCSKLNNTCRRNARPTSGHASIAAFNHILSGNHKNHSSIDTLINELHAKYDEYIDKESQQNSLSANNYCASISGSHADDGLNKKIEKYNSEIINFAKALLKSSKSTRFNLENLNLLQEKTLNSTQNSMGSCDSSESNEETGMSAYMNLMLLVSLLESKAAENNAAQSKLMIQMNDILDEIAQTQTEDLNKKLKELSKSHKKHSVWGFLKGVAKLFKDLDKEILNVAKLAFDSFATGKVNLKDLLAVKSGAESIKNNEALKDIGDIGKLCVQVIKLLADLDKDLISGKLFAGKVDNLKSDFTKIEENPALGLLLEAATYIVAVSAVLATGGSASALIFAAMTTLSALNVNVLDLAAKEIGKLCNSQIAGDIIVGVLALALAGAGGYAMSGEFAEMALGAGMTLGVTMTTMADKIAKDANLSGNALYIFQGCMMAAGMILTMACGYKMAGMTEVEGAEAAEAARLKTIQETAGLIQKASLSFSGVLTILNAAKTIDIGKLTEAMLLTQGNLNITQNMVGQNSDNQNTISKQLKALIEAFNEMNKELFESTLAGSFVANKMV